MLGRGVAAVTDFLTCYESSESRQKRVGMSKSITGNTRGGAVIVD